MYSIDESTAEEKMKLIIFLAIIVPALRAHADYQVTDTYRDGVYVMTVTQSTDAKFKFIYVGQEDQVFYNNKKLTKIIFHPGRPKPTIWTIWGSGQTNLVKVFDLNCTATEGMALRLDKLSESKPDYKEAGDGLRVNTADAEDDTTSMVEKYFTNEWLVPYDCGAKPTLLQRRAPDAL
jgi:hypothetical protein